MANIYNPDTFIKTVISDIIQIQNSNSIIKYSINYNEILNISYDNIFLKILLINDEYILEFLNIDDTLSGYNKLKITVNQLKNNTYNYINTSLDNYYIPSSFIRTIDLEFSIELLNNNNVVTYTLVSSQIVSIYASNNFVKVKMESTDTIIKLLFEDNNNAIEGARLLRLAMKDMNDRNNLYKFSKIISIENSIIINNNRINYNDTTLIVRNNSDITLQFDSSMINDDCKFQIYSTPGSKLTILENDYQGILIELIHPQGLIVNEGVMATIVKIPNENIFIISIPQCECDNNGNDDGIGVMIIEDTFIVR